MVSSVEGAKTHQNLEQVKNLRELGDLAEYLTGRIFEAGSIHELEEFPSAQLFFADVEEGIGRFKSELEIARERDGQVFGAVLSDDIDYPAPIDSREFLAALDRNHPYFQEALAQGQPWLNAEFTKQIMAAANLEVATLDTADATTAFIGRLARFLFYRLLGSTVRLPGGGPPTGGSPPGSSPPSPAPGGVLPFTVHTNTGGLRIWSCPAYLVGRGRVFGSPSTPVSGWIRPGRFIFGTENSSGTLSWDQGVYDVPPATQAHLPI
jgi:hypothetical protein